MFVANLRPEWEDLGTFRSAMDSEGDVIRCFIMCNPQGASKARFWWPAPAHPPGQCCIVDCLRNPFCFGSVQECCLSCRLGDLVCTVSSNHSSSVLVASAWRQAGLLPRPHIQLTPHLGCCS